VGALRLSRIGTVGVVVAAIAHACGAGLPAADAVAVDGPSFSCDNATDEIEVLICGDLELTKLDWQVAAAYNEATTRVAGKTLAQLKAEQRAWVAARNDCRKADHQRHCTRDAYTGRLATLQARFGLIEAASSFIYACDDRPDSQITVTYFKTDPPSANLVRSGGERITVLLGPTGSGARYEGPSGVLFWEKGGEAMVEWPQGTQFHCKVKP
jgi:uncharacterized protein